MITITTKDTVVIKQEDENIILTCAYHLDTLEEISDKDIRWQKKIGDEYKDLAIYSTPGGTEPFIEKKMKNLYENRTELIAPNNITAPSAVMIIKGPVCSDEGSYQCWIRYNSYGSTDAYTSTNQTVVIFSGKYISLTLSRI